MNSISKQIRQAYFDALDGNISVDVYKEEPPMNVNTHHVIIRVESETAASNSTSFVTKPVVIVECVGVFTNSIDPDVVDDIDNEVRNIIKPDRSSRTFTVSGIQISNIKADSSTLLQDDDGTKRYFRKITRWTNRVSHT
jgi:hypothetical protein